MIQLKYQPGFYLAYVLTDQSRNELLKLVPPAFSRVICHHVTLAFWLNETLFDNIMETVGETPTVVVTGHLKCDNIECFKVEINGQSVLKLNGQNLHITESLNPPAKPVDSNKMLTHTPVVNFSSKNLNITLSGSVEMVRK